MGSNPTAVIFKSLESSTQTRPSTAHADMNQTVCQSATHERRLHYGDSTRCHDELMFTLATQLISVHQTNSPCLVKGRPTCCPTASARWVAQVHAKRQRQIQIRIATPESEYISAWPDVRVAPIVSLAQGTEIRKSTIYRLLRRDRTLKDLSTLGKRRHGKEDTVLP